MPNDPAAAIWYVGGLLLAPLLAAVLTALVLLVRETRRQGELTRGVLNGMREDLRRTRGAADRAETSASSTVAVLREIRDSSRSPSSQRNGTRTAARGEQITLPSCATTSDPDAAPSRPSRPSRPSNGEL